MALGKNTLITVFLAAGLSLGLLSGCGDNGQNNVTGNGENPTSTAPKTVEITQEQKDTALKALTEVEAAVDALKTYTDKIDPSQLVKYEEVKTEVDNVYKAYTTFRDNLSDPIKTQIKSSDGNKQVEELFKEDSKSQKILAHLVDGDKVGGINEKYKTAQEGLRGLKLTDDEADGDDDYGTKFATRRLLQKKIVNDTQKALNSLKTSINALKPSNNSSDGNDDDETKLATKEASKDKKVNDRQNFPKPLTTQFEALNSSKKLIVLVVVVGAVGTVGTIIVYTLKKPSSQQGSAGTRRETNKNSKTLLSIDDISKIQKKLRNISKNIVPRFPGLHIFNDIAEIKEKLDILSTSDDIIKQKFNTIITNTDKIVPEDKLRALLKEEINKQTTPIDTIREITDQLQQQLQQTLQEELEKLQNQYKQLLLEKIAQLEAEKDTREQDKESDRQAVTEGATQTGNISPPWSTLVDDYNNKPEDVLKSDGVTLQGEFIEDLEQGRREDNTKPVIFKSASANSGQYYIVSYSQHYLLFPKENAIPPSQEFTASGSFEGYKSESKDIFTLEIPAEVVPCKNKMWKLKQKGTIRYSS